MSETPGVHMQPMIKTFGDDEGDDVQGDRPTIPFQIFAREVATGGRESFVFEAVGMVPYKVLRSIGTYDESVYDFFDDVLRSDDGDDTLPDAEELGDGYVDALDQVKPADLSSRARWFWLWGDQTRFDVMGGHYQKTLEFLVGEYQDRHGIERVPTVQSGRSSSSRTGRTGSGSRARRR